MDDFGYFGVFLAERLFYQGYYLPKDLLPEGERILRDFRAKVAGSYMEPSAVNWEADGVAKADQPLFGAICGTLVEVAITHTQSDAPGKLAAALHLLSGHRFFIVRGKMAAAGNDSSFQPLNGVSTIDEARAAINTRPEAIMIQKKLAEVSRRNPPARRH